MQRNILTDYLAEIARIRATRAGTGEISYYGALAGALNAAGERLKPRVFCVPNLRNRGSGFPDMGLFVVARGHAPEDWPEAHTPERGVVEVDDVPADLSIKLASAQVRRYLAEYRLVLVTNYRDFVLLGRDARGQPERRESFSFGYDDAEAFFNLARSPRRPEGLGARFAEFPVLCSNGHQRKRAGPLLISYHAVCPNGIPSSSWACIASVLAWRGRSR